MRGSVIKRGRTYTYVLSLGYDDRGKRRQKWVGGFATKREAEDGLTEALERVRTGRWADAGRLTLGEYCERWLDVVTPTVRPTTAASYADLLRAHVGTRIGTVRLSRVDPGHLGRLYAELAVSGRRNGGGGGLSPRTIQYTHRVLHHALADAVRWGLLPRNPADLVGAPRVPRKEMRSWTAVEVQTFLRERRDDRLRPLWLLLVATGMRRGEALGLRWGDVDLDGRTAAVRRALVVVGHAVKVAEPKTARGRRLVALDDVSVDALRTWRNRVRHERLRAGPGWTDTGHIFVDEIGRTLHPDAVSKWFRDAVEEASVPVIRLHDPRHTAASLALTVGVHPKIVSERLGHSSIAITLDTYSHVTPTMQAEAADRLGQLLFGAASDALDDPAVRAATSGVGSLLDITTQTEGATNDPR